MLRDCRDCAFRGRPTCRYSTRPLFHDCWAPVGIMWILLEEPE